MSSSQVQTIILHPFIRRFTFAIIKTLQNRERLKEGRAVVHADLIPRVTERAMQESIMGAPKRIPRAIEISEKPMMPVMKQQMFPSRMAPQSSPMARPFPIPERAKVLSPASPRGTFPVRVGTYGRIEPLLGDASISMIECPGPNRPVMVLRIGQRQFTKISLTPEEIKGILNTVADKAHIPLLEGVFRAAIDDFSINAIISDMVGSKFVIRKSRPMG